MNEHDPLSEWTDAIVSRIGTIGWLMILLAFLLCLVAPVFGPAIKQLKRNEYVLHRDYEARAEADMKLIRPILWAIAIIGWIVFVICQLVY